MAIKFCFPKGSRGLARHSAAMISIICIVRIMLNYMCDIHDRLQLLSMKKWSASRSMAGLHHDVSDGDRVSGGGGFVFLFPMP